MTTLAAQPVQTTVLVWDLPTRLFKWSLVLTVIGAYITAQLSSNTYTLHKYFGIAVLVLVVFRVLWGFFGGSTSRFASFVASPGTAISYLVDKRRAPVKRYLGHNPAGGLMIVTLLVFLLLQTATGIVASDGLDANGPFADSVLPWISTIGDMIHKVSVYALMAFVGVHIATNIWAQYHGEPLISAMVSGVKPADDYADARAARAGQVWVAIACLAVSAVSVIGFVKVYGAAL